MAESQSRYRGKAQIVGVYIYSRKAVFIYGKFNPVPFKAKINKQTKNSDYICRCYYVNNCCCNLVKLQPKVKARLCMHTIENNKAYCNVKKHYQAVEKCYRQINKY